MKPDTYTKLYVHAVFSPKGRQSLLNDQIKEPVQKYIYGILKDQKCFPVAINGMQDHIHLLFGFPPTMPISEIIRDVKRSSSLFVNNKLSSHVKFSWQEGYGAFTVSYKELDHVFKYILNQEIHHSKKTFRQEYINILVEEGVDYDPRYLLEFYE